MEDKFNNRDFEQFVKQNADQYRMFPSEKVWKNIHHTLHTRRRWYALGLTLLLLTVGIVTWVMVSPSANDNSPLAQRIDSESTVLKKEIKTPASPVLIVAANPAETKNRFITTTDNLQKNLFNSVPAIKIAENNDIDQPVTAETLPTAPETVIAVPTPHVDMPVKAAVITNKLNIPVKNDVTDKAANHVTDIDQLVSDMNMTDKKADEIKSAADKGEVYPLTIESVLNSYKHQRKGKKLSWEIFVTPTVSYRRLSENKEFINSTQTSNNIYNYYNSVADINKLVTHKPDIGIQLGFNAGYPLTKSLKILAGLQFNVSKYDIRVSYSTGDVATIALNTGTGANSVSTISNYRNNSSGSKADWLRNYYFSASVPVGVELKLTGNNKTQVGVIGTIQPSYILSDRAYLLTTDYKNYAEVPSLTRKLNMSGSFEIYAGVSTGNINWRIGPQVRYQLKSSYVAKYPFKEHLFDFGLKLGVMLKK
jgi:hypothetical protein